MYLKQGIPGRKIGENEHEVLERLWNQFTDSPEVEETALDADFEELQTRIRRKLNARRTVRRIITSGIAAAIVIGCIFTIRFSYRSVPVPTVMAQLHEMGVTVDNNQVVLKMDDERAVSLDSMASVEHTLTDLSLRTPEGEKLNLAGIRTLKLEVPAGKHFQVTLADGTQVWLNASSSLEYPVSFEGKAERRVKLVGEAFFEVKRDENTPFYVEIGTHESIQVLGTSFNVNAYPESGKHVTTLLSGKISYSSDEKQEKIILTPNQQVCLDCNSGQTEVAHVDASSYASWRDGWIYFEDECLETLAARLARLYGIRIEVDERVKNHAFSGKISSEPDDRDDGNCMSGGKRNHQTEIKSTTRYVYEEDRFEQNKLEKVCIVLCALRVLSYSSCPARCKSAIARCYGHRGFKENERGHRI